MRTEDLIANLSRQPSARGLQDRQLLGLAVLAVVVPVVLFLVLAGVRDGLGTALADPVVLPKTVLPALAFALALPELARLAHPEGPGETRLHRLALPALGVLGLGGLVLFDRDALASSLEPGLFGVLECLSLIPLLAAVPTVAGLALLRRGAVTAPGLAGAVAGFVAGSGAAAGYSLFCIRDNPAFYLIWYGVAIGLVTLAGRWAGQRWLVW